MRAVSPRGVFLLLLATTFGLAGCASGGGSDGGTSARRGPSTRIVQEELQSVTQLDVYSAIQRLRPTWLRTRSGGEPMAHVDGNILGPARGLQAIRAADVQEIQFMNSADATTRFGTNYMNGVILVTTRR
jgi:hypothetical protein